RVKPVKPRDVLMVRPLIVVLRLSSFRLSAPSLNGEDLRQGDPALTIDHAGSPIGGTQGWRATAQGDRRRRRRPHRRPPATVRKRVAVALARAGWSSWSGGRAYSRSARRSSFRRRRGALPERRHVVELVGALLSRECPQRCAA